LLRGCQQGNVGTGLCHVLGECLHDGAEMPEPAVNRRTIEEASVVVALQPKLSAAIDKVEEEVHVDILLAIRSQIRGESGKLQICCELFHICLDLNQSQS